MNFNMTKTSSSEGASPRSKDKTGFALQLVKWQHKSGRHDLPWQKVLAPYRVWVSEIMLQQTQVVTVISYFERFMNRFPNVQTLANAHLDEVLGLWSGLGYYSRARNLHRCAQQVLEMHGAEFPKDFETLQTLPGIGPSTAAAIASICFKERVPILDGNVKRVLCRLNGFDADLSISKHHKELWEVALKELPTAKADMPTYTQGIMDLGATICTPKNPKCSECPVQKICDANLKGNPLSYPVKSKRIKRTAQSLWMVCIENTKKEIFLEQRSAKGIWAGLYCFPTFSNEALCDQFINSLGAKNVHFEPVITHALTHKELSLHVVKLSGFSKQKLDNLFSKTLQNVGHWMSQEHWSGAGIPAPIRKVLIAMAAL